MIAVIAALALQSPFASEAPLSLDDIRIDPQQPTIYQPVEISFQLKGTWTDVFDPRQVNVLAEAAGGKDLIAEIPGFTDAPPHRWKVRFAPWSTGKFKVTITVFDTLGRINPKPIEFSVKGAEKDTRLAQGFVETKEKLRYFQTSDGKPAIFAEGTNCEIVDVTALTSRFDMPRFASIEAKLGEASARGGHLFLRLGSDSWLTEKWKSNPFNIANGGPCDAPSKFFETLQARLAYKRYLRYFVARLNAWPSWAGVIIWDGKAPEYWLEEMQDELRALHPYPIPVFSTHTEPDWLQSNWLYTACVPFESLRSTRSLTTKPIVVKYKSAAEAICSGASSVLGAKPSPGLVEFLSLIEWNKRKFDFRALDRGCALIDDNGGPICLVGVGQQPKGTTGIAVKRSGKYTCIWFKTGVEYARTSATSNDNDLDIAHPPYSDELLGLLKRD